MNQVFLELPLIEWIGYLASTIVLISLSLSSIVKLRIFNLIGSAIFSLYGFYIDALPVGIMNLIICFFNIYYLRSLLFKKEVFEGLRLNQPDEFVQLFLNYHKKDIERFFPDFIKDEKNDCQVLMAMRDMNVAGVMLLSSSDEDEANVVLDYVTPQYRDYKTSHFLIKKYRANLLNDGVKKLTAISSNALHVKYLQKVGFQKQGERYIMKL